MSNAGLGVFGVIAFLAIILYAWRCTEKEIRKLTHRRGK